MLLTIFTVFWSLILLLLMLNCISENSRLLIDEIMCSLDTLLVLFVVWDLWRQHCKIFCDWFRYHTRDNTASFWKYARNFWIWSPPCTRSDIIISIRTTVVIGYVQSTLTLFFINNALKVIIFFLASTAAHSILLCKELKPHLALINHASFILIIHYSDSSLSLSLL